MTAATLQPVDLARDLQELATLVGSEQAVDDVLRRGLDWLARVAPYDLATVFVLEQGRLGTWLLGEAGGILFLPESGRVHCFCVTATDKGLPPSDRIAHLLLALRSDEIGFATIANHAFSGAAWRVRRRLPKEMRPAFDRAR